MAGSTVKVKVRDGYAVYDGKTQRVSGTVEVDGVLAEQLLAAGAAEKVEDNSAAKRSKRS